MDTYEFMFELIFAFIGVFLVIGLVCLVFYILKGYALYLMAKRKGIENAWLAFIPFGMDYIMGSLIGDVELSATFKINAKTGLPAGRAIGLFAAAIPIVGWLFSIAYYVYYFIALYKLYKNLKEESAVLYLILSIIFNVFAEGIILFTLKDLNPTLGDVITKADNEN